MICGEGIYPRWDAKQPQLEDFGPAAQDIGDKSPHHRGIAEIIKSQTAKSPHLAGFLW